MINEEKVKLMTKAAQIRRRDTQKIFASRSFFGTDYVSFQMLKAFVGITAGFVCVAALIILARFEEFTTAYTVDELFSYGKLLLLIYALVLFAGVLLSLLVYTTRYWEARDGLREYQRILKQIGRFYAGRHTSSGEVPGESRGEAHD